MNTASLKYRQRLYLDHLRSAKYPDERAFWERLVGRVTAKLAAAQSSHGNRVADTFGGQ